MRLRYAKRFAAALLAASSMGWVALASSVADGRAMARETATAQRDPPPRSGGEPPRGSMSRPLRFGQYPPGPAFRPGDGNHAAVLAPLAQARSSLATATPRMLRLVGQWGGGVQALAIDGDRLWVGIGPRLIGLSLAGAGAPRLEVISDILPAQALAIAVSGDAVWAACGEAGLFALQRVGSGDLRIRGRMPLPAWDVVASGQAVIVAGYGITILTDPVSLRLGALLRVDDARRWSLAEADGVLYALGRDLLILDVRDLTNPQRLGRIELSVDGSPTDLAIRGDRLYVGYEGTEWIHDPYVPIEWAPTGGF